VNGFLCFWVPILQLTLHLICFLNFKGVFLFEYFLRLYAITAKPSKYYYKKGPVYGRFKFIVSAWSIIDIVSLVPSLVLSVWYYIHNNHLQIAFAREMVALRVLRILRLLKAERYMRASVC